ncbi:hypothetical protein IKW75_02775 [Candidatus Saccharibacteria bacterium]|nr:hypothetical protein [Candidatus Saccharibacteria bacterium]
MVCIAAFIILVLVGIAAALISIFNRDFGKKYLAALKKSFHCFGKRIRLQKCDTNFSDDVKTTLLKKVIIKKPKLVKPLSVGIEIASALLVILTVWSIIEAAKAGLALWVFGTCNVSQPSSCALGADSCSINEDNLNWFTEWGEIFSNIPDRVRHWNAGDYINTDGSSVSDKLTPVLVVGSGSDTMLEIIDPGCAVCLQSYKNILSNTEFLNKHTVYFVAYPIRNTDGNLRFKNSELITRYLLATSGVTVGDDAVAVSEKILSRIFTEYSPEGIIYQNVFNEQLGREGATAMLDGWLVEWGITGDALENIKTDTYSETIEQQLRTDSDVISSQIKPKGIPTAIYDGKKHLGLFK